jgi:hypothetical protein
MSQYYKTAIQKLTDFYKTNLESYYDRGTTIGKRTAEVMGLKEPPKLEICYGKIPISKQFLEFIFKKKIPKEKQRYYRNKLIKNCRELTKDLNKLFTKEQYVNDLHDNIYKYITQEYSIPGKKSLEMLINLFFTLNKFFIPSSHYLLAYPSAWNLVSNAFANPDDYNALKNLYTFIWSININKGYDDIFFKKDFFNVLPDISSFAGKYIQDEYVLWASDKISTKQLLSLIDKVLQKNE